MAVTEFDPGMDHYEDDMALDQVREIAARPPDMVTTEPLSVLDVAAAILQRLGKIDTYRLQKLCYYAQAQHLAFYNTRLFSEPVEAWPNGPVVRDLWLLHRDKRSVDHLPDGDAARAEGRPDVADTLTYVLDRYGDASGNDLVELTHREQPWLEARAGLEPKQQGEREIPLAALRDYYRAFDHLQPVDEPGEPDAPTDAGASQAAT